MVSEKQQIASTANTQKGGVKTEEGKAIVRLNAITHGLTSKEVLPSEDGETLGTLRKHLMAEIQPEGELEILLIDLIVFDIWWLRRAVKMETVYLEGILEWVTKQIEGKSPEVIIAKLKMAPIESVP